MDKKPKDLFILEGISNLCFNKDFTKCALTKKDNKIYIYEVKDIKDTNTWIQIDTLKNHFLYISGLDWCPETNRILSCSYDKTVMIWEYNNQLHKWVPNNMNTTSKLGYLFCHWNTRGDKFVCGTSEKKLFMGYYSTSADWWTGRPIKGHKSSVVSARIDPSSLFIISGSTDMKVLVTSCYHPETDDAHLEAGMDKSAIPAFETVIYEVECGGWINNVNWSPSGAFGFATCQDGNVYVINPIAATNEKFEASNPGTLVIPKDDNTIYVVGYDREIYLYTKAGDKWSMTKKITEGSSTTSNKPATTNAFGGTSGGVAERLKMFGATAASKKASIVYTADKNDAVHFSQISSFTVKGNTIVTTDLAGFVKYWPF